VHLELVDKVRREPEQRGEAARRERERLDRKTLGARARARGRVRGRDRGWVRVRIRVRVRVRGRG
jgi:hypothetical protein